MAYQPKSYKKFVATAATATLVATAVVPGASAAVKFEDVSSTYKTAVDYLISKNITEGISDTKFGTDAPIKRGDAAIFIAKALGLDTKTAPSQDFTDVNSRVEGAVNAIVNAKIASGKTESKFAPDDYITRQEMAKILVNAYKLEAGDTKNKFTDVNSNWDAYVDALVENGVTLGKTEKTFAATDTVKRGEFALFIHRAENLAPKTPTVVSVSATNSTTLTLSGVALDKLTAADVTVAGNTVSYITAAADGKSATVTLGSAIVPDTDTKVSVKIDSVVKDFTVKYSLVATTAAVDAKNYDDDTVGQYVTFKVNNTTANVNDLLVNGYTVAFAATDAGADATATVFKNPVTGELNTGLTAGKVYKVQVTLSKGSDVIVSAQADVTIKNFELVASAIESHELTNNTAGITQNSSTLVAGDNVTLTELVAIQNGTETTLAAADVTTAIANGTLDIKSSSPAVISVDKATATLTANTPGNASVTISYGTVTKTLNMTVAQDARVVSKATPKSASLTTILSPVTNNTVTFNVFDQYGDPVNATTLTTQTSNSNIATAVAGASDADGKATLTVTPVALGNASITLKNAAGKTVGSVAVKVTDIASPSKSVLEVVAPTVAGQSDDATINLFDETHAIYKLQPYTVENVKLPVTSMAGYRVVFDKNVVSVDADTTGELDGLTGPNFRVDGIATGYSDIAVYDTNDVLVSKVRVTVTNTTPKISAVAFKAVPEVTFAGKKIDYKSVLDVTSVDGDDIVKGITLTSTVNSVVRINETDATLYVDKNGNAGYDAGTDTLLGTLAMAPVSGSDFTAAFATILTGDTTVAGDKGTLVVTVKNTDAPTPKIVGSTSITVNVPQ